MPSMTFDLDRRRLMLATFATTGAFLAGDLFANEVFKEIKDLKPGEFTWHPDRQPEGPVAVVVSLPEQRVHIYRNGVRIAVSTCSTGKQGHSTPTGVFVVLQKDKHHRSSTYNNAPMPNMNRLTWSGIALHAGNLPGYPASHGCIRLPMEFSERLFEITHLGTPVIISGSHSDPWELVHPGMVLSGYAQTEFEQVEAGLEEKRHPKDWAEAEAYPVTSIIASSADKRAVLIENGEVIAEGQATISGRGPLGSHVFVLNGAHGDSQGMHWTAISHNTDVGGFFQPEERALNRVSADGNFLQAMRARLHPGMIFITTDAPLHPERRSGRDFVIMS
ncbi:L,D-transpeptidase [Mesorhizobium sp. CAU 1741]|uniref:L,D-transpeptidase n=1 Tax=Mesorhizobium sp. CAU 1741 TaxID=3140366 RepID=UPI00325B77BF